MRVDRHLGVEVRIDREQAVGAERERVAVGARLGGQLGRDVAVRAGPVVDHHRLAEPRRQRLPDHAGDHVGGAAGREADHQPDGPRRIGLRRRGGHEHRDQGREHEADEAGHGARPPLCRQHLVRPERVAFRATNSQLEDLPSTWSRHAVASRHRDNGSSEPSTIAYADERPCASCLARRRGGTADVGQDLRDSGGVEEARLYRRGQVQGDVRALDQGPERLLGRGGQAHPLVPGADQDQEHVVRSRQCLDQMVRGRRHQRRLQLHRPPPGQARQPDRDHLGGRRPVAIQAHHAIRSCTTRSAGSPTSCATATSRRATASPSTCR